MSENREHVSFEELNDYLDGRLDKQAAIRVSEHITQCQVCASEHDQLTQLLAEASAAKISVDPGEDLWTDVKQAIQARKEVALPVIGDAPFIGASKTHVRVSPILLAAAAVVLIVLSSGVTAVMLRRPDGPVAVLPNSPQAPNLVLPASFQATEDEYARTIRDLRVAVDAQRQNLSPETVRTVDHSLAVIDSAIAEARAALIADPNNRTLVDLLASSYQRKLDLLRRTSELSPKI